MPINNQTLSSSGAREILHMRQALGKFNLRDPRVRELLLIADNQTCQICFERIERLEHMEADHIIQRHHGGATIVDNIRAAHAWCNRRRRRNDRPSQPEPAPVSGQLPLSALPEEPIWRPAKRYWRRVGTAADVIIYAEYTPPPEPPMMTFQEFCAANP